MLCYDCGDFTVYNHMVIIIINQETILIILKWWWIVSFFTSAFVLFLEFLMAP